MPLAFLLISIPLPTGPSQQARPDVGSGRGSGNGHGEDRDVAPWWCSENREIRLK